MYSFHVYIYVYSVCIVCPNLYKYTLYTVNLDSVSFIYMYIHRLHMYRIYSTMIYIYI